MSASHALRSSGWPVVRAEGGRMGRLAWWGLAAGLGAVVLLPLLVVDVPPILDYPNHLARLFVLAHGGDPVLSRFYAPHWAVIPNLAIDALVPPLLRVLPVHVAGRLMLAVTLLLPGAGVLAYHRAVFRERLAWPLLSALVLCNAMFLLGFINFQLSLGGALLVAAGWARWREEYPVRCALGCMAGAVAVFFCHLGGLLFLAVLLGSQEAEGVLLRLRAGAPALRRALAGTGLLGVALLPAGLLYLASGFGGASSRVQWLAWPDKVGGLFYPVMAYDARLDALSGLLLLGFVGACALGRRWRMPLRGRIALLVVLGLYLAAPFSAKGGAWIDARFTVMLGLLLFAGGAPRLTGRVMRGVVLVAVGLLVVRTGVVAAVWSEHAAELRELRGSIAAVEPGARVLVVRVSPQADPGFWERAPRSRRVTGARPVESHDAALLLIERRAFWPLLFADPAQQPLLVRPAYRALSVPVGDPPDWRDLLAPGPEALRQAPYLADWRRRFDDVLVLDAEGVPDLSQVLPGVLERVNGAGFAALYRVVPAGAG